MSLAIIILLSITAKLIVHVSAQIEANVTCYPSNTWMSNSLNQNPCLVGAYLQARCRDGSFNVQPMSHPRDSYVPLGNGTDTCTCSTVTYSLMAACGICQYSSAVNWSVWDQNCSSPDVGGYPFDIPSGTAIPGWAYQNVTLNNTFDRDTAFGDRNNPESTAPLPTTSASSTASMMMTSSTMSTSSAASPSSNQSSSSSSSKSSHVGTIAGIAVGGFVALGVIGITIVVYLNRRRLSRRAPSWEYTVGRADSPPQSPEVMSETNIYSIYSTEAASKPYDPWDPIMFSDSSAHTTSIRSSGLYRYAPEVGLSRVPQSSDQGIS